MLRNGLFCLQVLIPASSLDGIPAVSGGLDAVPPAASPPPPAAAPSPSLVPPAASPPPPPAVPSPTQAPAAAPTAAEPAVTAVQGVALATGYLKGCLVQLSSAGSSPQVRLAPVRPLVQCAAWLPGCRSLCAGAE